MSGLLALLTTLSLAAVADDVAPPARTFVARSPRGELWVPRSGALCDPSGRWLRLARVSAAADATAGPESFGSLDLESPLVLQPGEPRLAAEAAPAVPPALFPPEDPSAAASADLELWPGSLWQLEVGRAANERGERPLFLRSAHTGAIRPLGELRGGERSLARLDAPRRRVLLCERAGAGDQTELSWLPLDGTPAGDVPHWTLGDESAARARADSLGRTIFAHLRIPHRALAEYMETRTLADARVRAELARLHVPLKLDAGQGRERFEQLFGERGALGSAVLAADGEAIAVLKGFAEPEVLLEFLLRAEALEPRWSTARRRWRECPRDEEARLAFALARLEGEDFVGAERLLLDLLCDGSRLARARAHAELARLEIDRGRVQEALQHLAAYRALDLADCAGARVRADYAQALLARARRRPAQAARVLEESFAMYPTTFAVPERLIELSLAWHEEGDQALGQRGLVTIARRYAGTRWGNQAEACLQHMTVPHGH